MTRTVDGRLAYADLLRVLATIAAVVLYISVGWLDQTAAGSTARTVMYVYSALTRWCVPIFAMLSGAFLLDPKKQVNLRSIFFKYILRVLAALLAWGIFYALLDYGRSDRRFTWDRVKIAFGYVLGTQTHDHLWFLYVMIGLYLITPILRAFVRGASRGDFHWFFILAFAVCSVLPVLQQLWPAQTALPTAWLDKLDVHLALGYVGYYVAGYYLKNYTLGRFTEFIIYVLGILGAAATVCGGVALSIHPGNFHGALLQYYAPNVAFMSVAIFVLFRYALGEGEKRSRRRRLGGAAKITFGIYLVHDFFIMLLRYLDISTLSFTPILSIPALSAAVFLCSFAVSWLISKIPLLGRYLT